MTVKQMLKILILSILVILFFVFARLSVIERQIKDESIKYIISGTIDTSKYPTYSFQRGLDNVIFNSMIVQINNKLTSLTLEQSDYSKFIKINIDTPLNNVDFEITKVELNSGQTIHCITGLIKNNIKIIDVKISKTSDIKPVFLHCSNL